jgi:hypothetical protein
MSEQLAIRTPEEWRLAVVDAYQRTLIRKPERVTCTDIYRTMSWFTDWAGFNRLWSWWPSRMERERVSVMRAELREGRVQGLRLTCDGVGRGWVIAVEETPAGETLMEMFRE